jgi:hypothetical protein
MKTFILGVGLILIFLFFSFYTGKKTCESENKISEQKTEIITKEIIINETKKVNERRVKALTIAPDANILWLQENICQDCR